MPTDMVAVIVNPCRAKNVVRNLGKEVIEAFAVAVCLHRDLDASQNETLLRDVTVRVAPTRRMSMDRIAVTSSKSRQLSVNFGEVLPETFVIFWTI
jgi:hypothetical protein